MLLAAGFQAAHAATPYPTKSIRFVVGFPPGGGNDAMARLFGQKFSERFGQSVVIDNRPGAGGNLAAEMVAKSAADGYTILVISSSHPIQGLLKKHLTYDPIRDFSSVAQLVHYRSVLVTHPSVGAATVRDLIAQAKARPGQINFVSPGVGTGAHLAGELFRYMTGVNISHIPYKGTGQATTDLMGGRVQMMFTPTLAVTQHVQAGRLRALGVTSVTRSRVMSDLPTLAEAGVTGYEFGAWYGILGPARMPADVVNKLNAEAQRALQTQEIKDRLNTEDLDPANATPAQLDDIRKAELVKWRKIVTQLGLTFE
ncbi:MAG TPA: tripartite tricarboxylate transporter substrate binding protein [Burkholderiales bacterium]|nr:tripartite tricarboxylate transporter substrate binding protein [Burkholderiales bacterium]